MIDTTKTITLKELKAQNLKVARFAANRQLDAKNVASMKRSLIEFGQQCPAIYVPAEMAIKAGLKVTDFHTDAEVTAENAKDYIVITDGQHRYDAYTQLEADKKKNPKGDFYFLAAINVPTNIVSGIMQMNITPKAWKGSDFVGVAAVKLTDKCELLKKINALTSTGYSADAAAKWYTFKGIKKNVFQKAVSETEIPEELKNTNRIADGDKLLEAAKKGHFEARMLQTRTLIDWIIKKMDTTNGKTYDATIDKLCQFLSSRTTEDVDLIKSKTDQFTSKQESMYQKLNEMWENFTPTTDPTSETPSEGTELKEAA